MCGSVKEIRSSVARRMWECEKEASSSGRSIRIYGSARETSSSVV